LNKIVWFRNDLRLHDHLPLTEASIRSSDKIIPVFVLPDFKETQPEGFSRVGSHRIRFLFESLRDLSTSIKKLGGELLILNGDPAISLIALSKKHEAHQIYAYQYPGAEERSQDQTIRASGIELNLFEGHSLIHPKNLPFDLRQLPKVFTAFRKKVEARLEIEPPLSPPSNISFASIVPDLDLNALFAQFDVDFSFDSRTAVPFVGGESAGLKRVEDYFKVTRFVSRYKETRNGLIGVDYSTKFSLWLANGSLSPRWIYHQLKAYESHYGANESTYWVFFELLWRDFFYFNALKAGGSFFKHSINHTPKNANALKFWMDARTGHIFIDAAMRELASTGYTSNRMRQNIASFLIHNLKGDWVSGARYFEHALIDYDCYSNYGNWTYLAGNGNDPRPDRMFNPDRQAMMYDPDGSFQKLWRA
jgi:deoxyribodipyrimidine photo-lyase